MRLGALFPALSGAGELVSTLRAYRSELLAVALLSMATNVLMLTPTLYMLQVFDRVMVSQSGFTLLAVSAIVLLLFVAMAISEWARSRLLVRAGVRFDEQIHARVFEASLRSALADGGRASARAFSDLTNLRQFLTGNGVFAFFDAPWTPVYIGVLFLLHPMLGGVALVFSVILVAMVFLNHWIVREAATRSRATSEDVNGFVLSKLRNAEVIEALGMVDHLRRRWSAFQNRHLRSEMRSQDLGMRMQAATKFVRYSQQSLMLGAGALLVIEGELTVGGMIAANVLMSRALAPIDLVAGTWKAFISARASYAALDSLLGAHPAREARAALAPLRGHVRLESLVATAAGRERPILRGLDASFAAGESVAIIGPTGSGKTTLGRALVGNWPGIRGRVLVDGEPIEDADRMALGPQVGYLPQDIALLEGSIAENIARFGEVDPAKVIEAARCAGVHEMILRFPAGYDTQAGEFGHLLSGGQRQRIGLARAVYGNPALIVLDEPDANLDEAGDRALAAALRSLASLGKTVFVISHRMHIVSAADRILLLVDGEILANGPRAKVLAELAQAPAGKTHADPTGRVHA